METPPRQGREREDCFENSEVGRFVMSEFVYGMFAGAAVLFIFLSVLAVGNIPPDFTVKKAIEHNCAQYNPQTGNFEWRK